MPVIDVENEADFQQRLDDAGLNLVVVRITTSWCEACKVFVKSYEDLSVQYSNATFLNFDIETTLVRRESAESVLQGLHYHRNSMPSFVLFKNKTQLETVEVGSKAALEAKISSHYSDITSSSSTAKGMMSLNSFISKKDSECLNESDDHSFVNCLEDGVDSFLESDCDEQVIISLAFNQVVKMHSLSIKAPPDKGPKNLKVFINQPNTLDFDGAESMNAVQEISLTQNQLDGTPVILKFVKFQNVQNVQVFVKDNQSGADITQIDFLGIIGTPIGTTNMSEFNRVAGKKKGIH